MRATHTIKINGKWYRAGDELPSPELKRDLVDENSANDLVKDDRSLTDDDLSMAELRIIAKERDIKVPIGTSKSELKEMLGM